MKITIHAVYDNNNRKDASGSYTNLTDEEVLQLVKDNWDKRTKGDTQGCWYVQVDGADWYTPEVQLQPGDLTVGVYEPRNGVEHDVALIHDYALVESDKKTQANECYLVVYETGTPDEYALVTALATHGTGVPPMNLMTALRNIFCDRLPNGGGGSPIEKLKTAEDKLDYIFDVFMFWSVGGRAQPAPKDLLERLKKELKWKGDFNK